MGHLSNAHLWNEVNPIIRRDKLMENQCPECLSLNFENGVYHACGHEDEPQTAIHLWDTYPDDHPGDYLDWED